MVFLKDTFNRGFFFYASLCGTNLSRKYPPYGIIIPIRAPSDGKASGTYSIITYNASLIPPAHVQFADLIKERTQKERVYRIFIAISNVLSNCSFWKQIMIQAFSFAFVSSIPVIFVPLGAYRLFQYGSSIETRGGNPDSTSN